MTLPLFSMATVPPSAEAPCPLQDLPVGTPVLVRRKIPGTSVDATFLLHLTGLSRGRVTGNVAGIVCTGPTRWKAGRASNAGIDQGVAMSAKVSDAALAIHGRIYWCATADAAPSRAA